MRTNAALYAPIVGAIAVLHLAIVAGQLDVFYITAIFALAWPWLYGGAWSVVDLLSQARRREEAAE